MSDKNKDSAIGIGILGAANIARKNCRGLTKTDKLRLVAIGSRDKSKAERLIEDYRSEGGKDDVKAYGSYDEVLEDPNVDAVYIPLPTQLHVEWVLRAVSNKKHILLEKPIAVSAADSETMINACIANGLQFMDGTMWMHHPRAQKMLEILQSGEIGPVRSVHSEFTFNIPNVMKSQNIRFKKDCDSLGALGDMGWYCTRGILFAYDYECPISVTAHPGARFNGEGVSVSMGATLLFSGDRRAIFECGFDRALCQKLEIGGSLGTITLNDFIIPRDEEKAEFIVTKNHGFGYMDTVDATEYDRVDVRNNVPQETKLFEEFAHCICAIRDGHGPNSHWTRISHLTQKVVCAILESAEHDCQTIHLQ